MQFSCIVLDWRNFRYCPSCPFVVHTCLDSKLYEFMQKASTEDLVDTIVLAFNARDPRGGRGEREIGRKMLRWILNKMYFYVGQI